MLNSIRPLVVGTHTLAWGTRTYVMGILNVTPDSFSGDGVLISGDPQRVAMEVARRFVEAGVDFVDVGGESTRPGSEPVGVEEERRRVIPIVKALAREFPQLLLSVDTYKAAIAEEALEAGANVINDVWALRADPALKEVVARAGCPVILMHNRSNPASVEVRSQLGSAYIGSEYGDLLAEVKRELMDSVELARRAGIPDERIILDPGLGFGKKVEHNLELINRLGEVRALGFPVLSGPSRKSFIGYTLNLPPEQRLEGTAAAVAVSIVRGADIVRVHDVEPLMRLVRMTDAIVRTRA